MEINFDGYPSLPTRSKIQKKIATLQRLQKLLEEYKLRQKYHDANESYEKEAKRNRDMRHFLKEWQYNRDNKDPPEDLRNDKMLVTLWKVLLEEEDIE